MHQESAASAVSSPSSIGVIMNSWFTPTVLFILLNLIIGVVAYTSSLTNQKQSRNKPKITESPSLLHRLKSISHHQSQESQSSPPSQDIDTPFHREHSVQTRNLEAELAQESHYFFQEDIHAKVHHIFSGTHELSYQKIPAHYDDFQLPHKEILLGGGGQNISEELIEVESAEQNHQETPTHLVFNGKDSIFEDLRPTHGEKVVEENANEVSNDKVKGGNFTRTLSDIASSKSGLGDLEAEEIHSVEARRPKTVRERGSSKATDDDEEVDSKADDFINRFKHQLKLQRLDSIVRYRDVPARGSGGK